ncbi:MAG: hypothetical protein AAF752_03880 [Bacteroidota bacterium]
MKQFIFPSVIERHNSELRSVAPDMLHGLKIFENGSGYIIGQLAMSEGNMPQRAINSSPMDLDYKLLLKAGLLLGGTAADGPIAVTCGFPYATFQVNRRYVENLVGDEQRIVVDKMPYGGGDKQAKTVQITKVDVIPEIVGCITAARKGRTGKKGSFFIASLGYGTFEACLSTEDGIVQRTMISTSGIRNAVDDVTRNLMKEHYLGLRTEHQMDMALRRGSIVLNRRRIDLAGPRKQALSGYYQDVISPMLRNAWTDEDFERASTLILTGGGAHYDDLVQSFREEFDGILNIEIAENPETLASEGYCYHSVRLSNEYGGTAIGLDIGNSQTILSVIEKL